MKKEILQIFLIILSEIKQGRRSITRFDDFATPFFI